MNNTIVAKDTLNCVLDFHVCSHDVGYYIAWPIAAVIIVFLISVACILLARYRYKRQQDELEYYRERHRSVSLPQKDNERSE